MNVMLLHYTQNGKELLATAARLCYTSDKASDLVTKITPEVTDKMIKVAMENHHTSLLEHISFTFLISGVSRALTHQLVRHRLCTFHEKSQRYVKIEDLKDNCSIPESIQENESALKTFFAALDVISECYSKLVDEYKIPKEDARSILPNATHSQIIMTLNARQLIHMCGLRCCNRAWNEMRELFDLILKECRSVMPEIFDKVGPNCFMEGKCPEGNKTCGKLNSVIKKYTKGYTVDDVCEFLHDYCEYERNTFEKRERC